jgi:hypothetical protein
VKIFIFLSVVLISFIANSEEVLEQKMLKLDFELFDSFNKCKDESELKKHESFYDVNLEFYHDQAGASWDRKIVIDSIRDTVCGNLFRKLIVDSFKVRPIKNFGAITQGTHKFCDTKTNECNVSSEFTFVWENRNNTWVITRVISVAHTVME